MGWYARVYNHTKDTYSNNEYKYGTARIQTILKMEPGWEATDTIIGGGYGNEHHFISGGHGKFIEHYLDDETQMVIDYKIVEDPHLNGT